MLGSAPRSPAWKGECYARAVVFEWDANKAAANLEKHGISFEQAATVFEDPLADTYDDPDHSQDEQRFLTFGHTRDGMPLVVAHCDRGDRVRIVSARRMTRGERRQHERFEG